MQEPSSVMAMQGLHRRTSKPPPIASSYTTTSQGPPSHAIQANTDRSNFAAICNHLSHICPSFTCNDVALNYKTLQRAAIAPT